MPTDSEGRRRIVYCVGEERALRDVLPESEAAALLAAASRAGLRGVRVVDPGGKALWGSGDDVPPPEEGDTQRPILLEGEPAGSVVLPAGAARGGTQGALLALLADTLTAMAHNNLKRMLTTETHTEVVNRSYEELLETNRSLSASEQRYRELAGTLEIKVRERTEELSRAMARLVQQEKMASVGRLAAGVAHEINNPLAFVTSNLQTLKKYTERFLDIIARYQRVFEQGGVAQQDRDDLRKHRELLRVDAISADAGDLLRQTLEGTERVRKIVADLKGFSHIDEEGEAPADLNREIDRTLSVMTHEIPAGTGIVREFSPLPVIPCRPGAFNQLFLGLLRNAFQARQEGLRLTIRTGVSGDRIRIAVADNGPGVPADLRTRIFEPFFTTRDVGKGKGLGLTVAYDIVTAHGGTIDVEDTPGGGATFVLQLPIRRGSHDQIR
ncbi:MAG TPA: ATP-binding protein [Thermodesulfobacteriota bacterium]|nr:MAG: histidine kinase [Deltaproteobacteria bacterium 21-66-5]HQU12888.1 ATP-binding protein [Thermodesulfobacteriota bacterium]